MPRRIQDLAPAVRPLNQGIHVAREVKLWEQDWHFLLELQQLASGKGVLSRLVQHLSHGVSALKDAVEIIWEWVAWLHLLGGVPLLSDAGTQQ